MSLTERLGPLSSESSRSRRYNNNMKRLLEASIDSYRVNARGSRARTQENQVLHMRCLMFTRDTPACPLP